MPSKGIRYDRPIDSRPPLEDTVKPLPTPQLSGLVSDSLHPQLLPLSWSFSDSALYYLLSRLIRYYDGHTVYYRVFSSDLGPHLPDASMSRDIAKYTANHGATLSALFPTGVDPKSSPSKLPVQKPLDLCHLPTNGPLNKYEYLFIAKLYLYYRNYIIYSIKTKNNLRREIKINVISGSGISSTSQNNVYSPFLPRDPQHLPEILG